MESVSDIRYTVAGKGHGLVVSQGLELVSQCLELVSQCLELVLSK
jgi:hypothetical protein